MFDVVKHVEDETEVRRLAQSTLAGLTHDNRFQLLDRTKYFLTLPFETFKILVGKVVTPDLARQAWFRQVAKAMRDTYDALIEEFG